ncbi:MAG: hypothetical protein AAF957_05975 [Planctomycetota bacterium]
MKNDDAELKVQTPCEKRWAELKGEGSERWCEQCSLHVVDGASLTRAEARDLVTGADERVCMRLVRDADGRVLHADDPPARRGAAAALRAGLAVAAGMLAACWDTATPPDEGGAVDPIDDSTDGPKEDTERPIEIMGDVCYPEEAMGIVAPEVPGSEPQKEPEHD